MCGFIGTIGNKKPEKSYKTNGIALCVVEQDMLRSTECMSKVWRIQVKPGPEVFLDC